ncbi:MAG: hypothetical protein LBB81_09635 [Treponema sp.]|jgi:hypothetical protein|nr:hypothetical protein [Treponema sp.]
MGLVYAEVTSKNIMDKIKAEERYIKEPEIRRTTVQTVVDTGSQMLTGAHGDKEAGLLL